VNLYYSLTLGIEHGTPVSVEPSLKYHPWVFGALTWAREPGRGHCLVGSLTGAVASEMVTEALKGSLRLVGHQPQSAKA
jgi:hypothetical protein